MQPLQRLYERQMALKIFVHHIDWSREMWFLVQTVLEILMRSCGKGHFPGYSSQRRDITAPHSNMISFMQNVPNIAVILLLGFLASAHSANGQGRKRET